MPTMTDTFAGIYQAGTWANGSGIGSYQETTLGWRDFLTGYIKARRITSVVDLGCGDWQTSKLLDWTGIDYLGIDCVPEVIGHCDWCHSTDTIRFRLADITTCPIPAADLIIIKDVFQHWPNGIVGKFLTRIARRRALIINDTAETNEDTTLGGYRPLDITRPPFNVRAKLIGYWSPPDTGDPVAWCKTVHETEP